MIKIQTISISTYSESLATKTQIDGRKWMDWFKVIELSSLENNESDT